MTQPVELQGNMRFDGPWYTAEQLSHTTNKFSVLPSLHTQNWLLNIESLTERLTQCCSEFTVDVLSQKTTLPQPDELNLICHSVTTHVVVREVVLRGDSASWVFARSVFPEDLTQDVLKDIGDQPLGKLLFNDSRFERQSFMVALIFADDAFVSHLLAEGVISKEQLAQHVEKHHGIWARRSVFTYVTQDKTAIDVPSSKAHHILVSEVFLPGAPAYA